MDEGHKNAASLQKLEQPDFKKKDENLLDAPRPAINDEIFDNNQLSK